MSEYETRFRILLAATEAMARDDFDAVDAIEEELGPHDPDTALRFVAELCRRAGDHVEEVGADRMGQALWYQFGVHWGIWVDVHKATLEVAREAIFSLNDLYSGCFARHLEPRGYTVGGASRQLETACYMLWDMDGGLESIPMHDEPKALVAPCFHVLERALALPSPVCQESALHGLGHIQHAHPGRVRKIIGAFLNRDRRTLPPDIVEYAEAAREGNVQ